MIITITKISFPLAFNAFTLFSLVHFLITFGYAIQNNSRLLISPKNMVIFLFPLKKLINLSIKLSVFGHTMLKSILLLNERNLSTFFSSIKQAFTAISISLEMQPIFNCICFSSRVRIYKVRSIAINAFRLFFSPFFKEYEMFFF